MAVEAPKSFSLFELNQHLKRVIKLNMREALWIRAEISEADENRGNWYLSLLERDEHRILAKASAFVGQGQWNRIVRRRGDVVQQVLRKGQQVLLLMKVDYSEQYGMQLIVQDVEPTYTIGQLEQMRQATLQRLQEEGFLDLNHQLPLPLVPQRIAVISSLEAAGYRDFIKQLSENPYGYDFNIELFSSAMQGTQVVRDFNRSIEAIEKDPQQFDCVVVVRGGGAKLDLVEFDRWEICQAIATCELPVLTGIGHDIDESLADLVAHTNLKTPTAVATFLAERIAIFETKMQKTGRRITELAQYQISLAQEQLKEQQLLLKLRTKNVFNAERQQLRLLEEQLKRYLPQKVLEQGFVLAFDAETNTLVSSVKELQDGQKIRLRWHDGEVEIVYKK